ncbi:MAG: amino acid ABC transporter permease [Lachnospiraceae bacterium]|nr:amino acid ABC transporter permease [Lachnospiraceae bacterium]
MNERVVQIIISAFPKLLLYCVKVTVPLTIVVFILSIILALGTALVQIYHVKVLEKAARFYIWLFRGTPLIVQLYIIFFGLPSLGIMINAYVSAVIAFSLNYAAYNSETIRAAILAVPAGQTEAGYMIGLNRFQILTRIVLPQAARIAFPTLMGSLIGLTKDSSLAASITVVEMFKTAQQIAASTYEPFALYCEAAFIYLLLCTVLTFLQGWLEKKLEWKKPETSDVIQKGAA